MTAPRSACSMAVPGTARWAVRPHGEPEELTVELVAAVARLMRRS